MTSDQLKSNYYELERRIHELETKLNEVIAKKMPLDRLMSLEQVRAQWQASIPRLLDKLRDLEKIEALEKRVRALEAAGARHEPRSDTEHKQR